MRFAALLVLFVLAPCVRAAEGSEVVVQRIKAAFLYKFVAYVEWPTNAFASVESPVVIGVLGAEGLAAELRQAVAERKAGGRVVEVRVYARGNPPVGCCQILYVGPGVDPARSQEVLGQVRGRAVLTVTDVEAGHPADSVINFLESDDRVRFDISREAADRNGLQVRSQLLAVARHVIAP